MESTREKSWLFLYLAWAIALVGFCMSVFVGEILKYEPCPLCWYQRIALFPLAILLGIGAYRNDLGIALYSLPLAILGALAALFQISERYFSFLQKAGVCNVGDNCAKQGFTLLGFLDFPTLSAVGFILIASLLFKAVKK